MITVSVDDQVSVAKEIVRLMKEIDEGGEHTPFSKPKEALEFIKANKPDVAYLDIEMPGMSGLELAALVKTASPKTNIIFVTGHEKFAYQAFMQHPSGFILKPVTKEALESELENLRNPVERTTDTSKMRVQCFGNFEVFDKEGHPIKFKRAKSKEMLAYMVDRRGALCSVGELCGIIFEDRDDEKALKKQIRVFLYSLRDDLKSAGLENVLVKGWNAYGIDCSMVECDFFKFLEGDSYAVNSFMGEYMIQYSWAKMTLGELILKPSAFEED